MNKKIGLLGTSFAVGSALLVTSAFAGIGDAQGYDAYKSAVKATVAAQNMTEKVTVSVKNNGSELLHINSTSKTDKVNRTASADITVSNGTIQQALSVYRQDGKQIIKASDSDVYVVAGSGKQFKDRAKQENSGSKDELIKSEVENVVDALVGNLKNYVTLSPQTDGTKAIDVQLSASQIPAVANAVSSLFIKAAVNEDHPHKELNSTLGSGLAQVKNSLPKLTQNIQIKEVDIHAIVNEQNQITNQTLNIVLSGEDAGGAAHDVAVQADIGLSDLSTTVPDKVNLEGKQVQTIEKKRGHQED